MIFQEFERNPVWQFIADLMGLILSIFKPIVYPIGQVMVLWIDFLLRFFPSENITIYFVIFFIIVISGIIVNCKWPGEKYVRVYTDETAHDEEKKKISHLKRKEKIKDTAKDEPTLEDENIPEDDEPTPEDDEPE
jgi:uncharacterized membrane protein